MVIYKLPNKARGQEFQSLCRTIWGKVHFCLALPVWEHLRGYGRIAKIASKTLKTNKKGLEFADLSGNDICGKTSALREDNLWSNRPGFNLHLFHFLAEEWENYLTSLSFSFLHCTVGRDFSFIGRCENKMR